MARPLAVLLRALGTGVRGRLRYHLRHSRRSAALERSKAHSGRILYNHALMAERGSWAGTASDLLRAATALAGDDVSKRGGCRPSSTMRTFSSAE